MPDVFYRPTAGGSFEQQLLATAIEGDLVLFKAFMGMMRDINPKDIEVFKTYDERSFGAPHYLLYEVGERGYVEMFRHLVENCNFSVHIQEEEYARRKTAYEERKKADEAAGNNIRYDLSSESHATRCAYSAKSLATHLAVTDRGIWSELKTLGGKALEHNRHAWELRSPTEIDEDAFECYLKQHKDWYDGQFQFSAMLMNSEDNVRTHQRSRPRINPVLHAELERREHLARRDDLKIKISTLLKRLRGVREIAKFLDTHETIQPEVA